MAQIAALELKNKKLYLDMYSNIGSELDKLENKAKNMERGSSGKPVGETKFEYDANADYADLLAEGLKQKQKIYDQKKEKENQSKKEKNVLTVDMLFSKYQLPE